MRRGTACLAILSLWLVLSGAAYGYYHFLHYLTTTGPFTPVPEKFDLNSLVNSTVPYLISEQGPTTLAPNDSFAGLVSQIRLAAEAWNGVQTSRLRLAFGGFSSAGSIQNGPGIDIIFDEVPPGLVAVGGPTVRADVVAGGGQPFIPIVRSVVILRRDLSQRPSFSEAFFLSMVHEIGHALGLQHTFTSGVMSTEITRASTKAQPLSADDIAGISLLYPTAEFLLNTGSISGRALVDGEPASMASVVAISPDGPGVSTLAHPDGTYRIEGLPPGSYYVYVHPLPPPLSGEVTPGNVVLPLDMEGRPFPSAATFGTQFYPGTRDITSARTVIVGAGSSIGNVDFLLTRREATPVYAVQTYSFPGRVAVKPAHLNLNLANQFLVTTGVGLVAGGQVAPNLNVSVVGNSAYIPSGGVRPYPPDSRYLQVDFQFTPFASDGPRHMLFTTPADLYVLPSAFRIVRRPPPSISSLATVSDASGRSSLVVEGTNLSLQTRILVDGIVLTPRGVDESGRLLVDAPPAAGGHKANVVALNPDGQSSLFLQGSNPPVLDYELVESPGFTMSSSALPPGTEGVIEITGIGTSFSGRFTSLAFGSSDISVKRLWVVAPDRLLANVAVSPTAAASPVTVTVTNGLQVINAPFGFRPQPSANVISFRGPALEVPSGRQVIQAGASAQIRVSGLSPDLPLSQLQVSVNDSPAIVQGYSGGLLTFQVPVGVPPGPAILRLIAAGQFALPIAIQIDVPPPAITAIASAGNAIDATRPARPGELLTLQVSGLTDGTVALIPSRLRIRVGSVEHLPSQVQASVNNPAVYLVQFLLDPFILTGVHPLTVIYDGRSSAPVPLNVRAQ